MSLTAHCCPEGHVTMPPHPRCPTCGREQTEVIDLTDEQATVCTWTTSTATPPGVRSPNHLAIVEFEVAAGTVRTIGQLTTDEVSIGDRVEPHHVEELRDPAAGIREPASQEWDGYRFAPVEE